MTHRATITSLAYASLFLLLSVQAKGQVAKPETGSTSVPSELPPAPTAPQVNLTTPLFLRPTKIDYGHSAELLPDPRRPYRPRAYIPSVATNRLSMDSLLRDGKLYMSLADAITLALENNYDIAIARVNLDIADTDILRARTGAALRGVSTGLVNNTLGGSSSTITGGGGPGGTTSASGGSGTGVNGLVLSTNGSGPVPEAMDPILTGTLGYEAAITPQTNLLLSGGQATTSTNTGTFDFSYQQGFSSGTLLNVGFNNSRVTTNSTFTTFSPSINTSLRATATQHLLQGFGPGINRRLIVQARNNRQITDSAFRQQVLYTVNQIENIYWALTSAYEDVQDKTEALAQSTQLTAENRKQLDAGTLAALDIVNSDSAVASDKQALVASQTNLRYQQLVLKQALVRRLNDRAVIDAPIVPTDRVSLERLPEEDMPTDDLVNMVLANNPQIEQAELNMKNNRITIRAEKNGLLPVVDLVAFYGGSALAGAQNPGAQNFLTGQPYPAGTFPSTGYGGALGDLFNNSAPDRGVALNVTIPLRNRLAQADQARSEMEMEQTQMRLEQLHTQLRIQATNAQFALEDDRAQVAASEAARDYAKQSLHAEERKYTLGASTAANVLQQRRLLAIANNSALSAVAAYARDRAALLQLTAKTLDRYGFDLGEAATGDITSMVHVPGLGPQSYK